MPSRRETQLQSCPGWHAHAQPRSRGCWAGECPLGASGALQLAGGDGNACRQLQRPLRKFWFTRPPAEKLPTLIHSLTIALSSIIDNSGYMSIKFFKMTSISLI